VSETVDGLRLCINYKAKSFATAPRITEEIDLYPWEIEERIRSGIFLDDDYGHNDDMGEDEDAPVTFLEQHRRWDLDGDGYPEPYIVTIARDSGRLARIVAAYDMEGVLFDAHDHRVRKIEAIPYYTKYSFIPSPDSAVYDIGFGNLLYPLNEAINTSLNQMFDAGHLANAGGGFMGAGMNMNTGSVRFQVGEYKVVNTPGATLRENLVPLNFPGPNGVLFSLLQYLVDAGREIASVKDILSGEIPGANTPGILGLAVIQQGLKVFSAIFKRVHRSLGLEFQKLFRLNRLYLPDEAGYRVGTEYFRISRADYEKASGVEPVSDPEVVTDMQKMARANFMLQFKDDPWCDGREIRRRAFEAAAIPEVDKVLLDKPAPNPEAMAKAAELNLRAQHEKRELDIRQSHEEALKIAELANAVLRLAQARKADAEVDQQWIDLQITNLKAQVDALTANALPGASNAGGGAPGAAGPAGGSVGGGNTGHGATTRSAGRFSSTCRITGMRSSGSCSRAGAPAPSSSVRSKRRGAARSLPEKSASCRGARSWSFTS
jgi:chaperonin GroES